jgi:hypothetical protein
LISILQKDSTIDLAKLNGLILNYQKPSNLTEGINIEFKYIE